MNGRESLSALRGKTAVVTGGTRGIGRAISVRLAREGARVLLAGTDDRRSRAAAAEIAELTGADVIGTRCDVSDEPSVLEFASLARAEFGHVDALVNNAGIAVRNAIPDITAAEWNHVFTANVTGTFLVIREMLPLMTEPGAAIVNIASQAGKRGQALLSHYSASKAAVINMTKTFALELAPSIRINAVCPGFIETDMMLEHYQVEAGLRGITPAEVRAEMVAKVPLGRVQSPESIASLTLFLLSAEAEDMTGQALNVTGGMVME